MSENILKLTNNNCIRCFQSMSTLISIKMDETRNWFVITILANPLFNIILFDCCLSIMVLLKNQNG